MENGTKAIDVRDLCSHNPIFYYQFIDYDALYGSGGFLCYRGVHSGTVMAQSNVPPMCRALALQHSYQARKRFESRLVAVEPCMQMLAIQDTCGSSCCRDGDEGSEAFRQAAARHNFASDSGPGPVRLQVLPHVPECPLR